MALIGFHYQYDYFGAGPMAVAYTCVTGTSFAKNDLLEFSSTGLIQKAADGSTRIAGVAIEGVTVATAGQKAQVEVSPGAVFRAAYTPGTKAAFAGTDIGLSYDLTTALNAIDPDDTTGAMCVIVDFDNDAKTADVLIKNRLLNNL